MISIGMIFQYNEDLSSGLIMLTDGEQRDFNIRNWVDTENSPKVGLKISYEENPAQIKIRAVTKEDEERALLNDEEQEEEEVDISKLYSTVDEYIEHYKKLGFKLASDSQTGSVRTVTFRIYTPEDYGEATVEQNGSQINVTQILNGKTI